MRISEVAQHVGLDISSIRFYEKKGLIDPARSSGSNYRDYTDEDILRLKQIILFRKMDLSIDNIKSLILGNDDLPRILHDQQKALEMEKAQIEGSLTLCKKILEDEAFEDIDIDYYLAYVEKAEQGGQKFPDFVPVLDRIAENLDIEGYPGYLFSLFVLRNKWLRRIAAVFIFGLMVIFPAYEIATHICSVLQGHSDHMRLVFWCFYAAFSTSAFVRMIKPEK